MQKHFLISRASQCLLALTLALSCALSQAQPQIQPQPQTAKLLVLGDSLSAGYGIAEAQGWVQLLRNRLQEQQLDITVINASVSGETSSGGNARLGKLLDLHQPSLVIVELGGNDGLRGYPINSLKQQLQQSIEKSQKMGAQVLLLGMQIPPNYGKRYTELFRKGYEQLAQSNQVALVPFFLDGVATDPNLMQTDGIHPTAAGQPQLLDNIWPQLKALLDQ